MNLQHLTFDMLDPDFVVSARCIFVSENNLVSGAHDEDMESLRNLLPLLQTTF